ncbi:MAG: PKD domain-containing protein [Myxococcota bacterium]
MMTDLRASAPASRPSMRGGWPPLANGLALLVAFGLLACQSQNDGAVGATGTGRPQAAFFEDRTQGAPGVEVQFTDGSTGDVTDYVWDFGAAGTRNDRNPRVRFDAPGVYSVSLTVRGPGGANTLRKEALIAVDAPAQAGLDCLPAEGFAPLTVACSDASTGATTVGWNFGDGVTSSKRNPVHVYATAGSFTVTQRAASAGGTDVATTGILVHPLAIGASPGSGSALAPATVLLTAEVGGLAGMALWTIDGQLAGTGASVAWVFRQPGTHRVELVYGLLGSGIVGTTAIDYVVGYSPATADFAPTPAEGTGPMTVQLADRSSGAITRWDWDFGDGSGCTWPAPAPAGAAPLCNAAGPTHVYDAIGSYDVRLTVTGPAAVAGGPAVTSTKTTPDAVRVLLLDASFEAQTANGAIGGAWTALRPPDELEPATHRSLSTASGGGEAGMPTDGSKWAVLDGLGTRGTTPVDSIQNGIEQVFLRPVSNTVVELDYALLFAEPPAGSVMDAVTATITEVATGTTIEIPSARTDVSSAYQGTSTRYPTRDGSTMRVTPTFTAALDLAQAFPSSTPDSLFRLTIRVANAVNAFRSPRAYVDHVRFTAPTDVPQTAGFFVESDPIVAGRDIVFTDESCLDPQASGCEAPTSWRWDFGTSRLATPPASSGSRAPSPTYRFPEPGVYDVALRVARADRASTATLTLTVLAGPEAAFEVVDAAPHVAPASLHFEDRSTSDPSDPIVARSWDFGGWGTSTAANPGPVVIGQVGDWTIRLEVTTASGQTSVAEAVITVE